MPADRAPMWMTAPDGRLVDASSPLGAIVMGHDGDYRGSDRGGFSEYSGITPTMARGLLGAVAQPPPPPQAPPPPPQAPQMPQMQSAPFLGGGGGQNQWLNMLRMFQPMQSGGMWGMGGGMPMGQQPRQQAPGMQQPQRYNRFGGLMPQ